MNLLALLSALALPTAAEAEGKVTFERNESTLAIRIDGKPFATYVWKDGKILRPYFAHLHAPDGTQVTRNHPPIAGKDATDHDTMHPGLWLAFGDLNGADFWRNKGTVSYVEFVEKPTSDKNGGRFAVRNRYAAGGKTICDEVCRIRIVVQPGGTLLDWDSTFTGDDEFAFGDQEEMGLGIRIATSKTVRGGGQILNSDGLKNEKQIWGKTADWCDYSGVMLMPHPKNFRPCWFHARDYGVLVANPFGKKAFTRGEKSRVLVKKGESFRLRFGVFIHGEKVDLAAAYKEWLAEK